MGRLDGKVIVVTGGTKGIGRGICEVCASEGAFVIIAGRDEKEGGELEGLIRSKGGRAAFFRSDLSRVSNCFALIDKTVELGGKIDGLVNNAGIFPFRPYGEVDEKLWDSVMAVNVKAPFFTIQRALNYMTERKEGSIVNIGSTHWRVGPKDMPVYAVSKGALRTLTENVGLHYMSLGVRCNWVSVGWVFTPGEKDKLETMGTSFESVKEEALSSIPSGRLQTPEEIASACVYLLSDESSQVTGADITVTGGFHSP
jgi:NAD(P)-dependent dehydrogenase (short-subunit alcohol dehydrogenase family)